MKNISQEFQNHRLFYPFLSGQNRSRALQVQLHEPTQSRSSIGLFWEGGGWSTLPKWKQGPDRQILIFRGNCLVGKLHLKGRCSSVEYNFIHPAFSSKLHHGIFSWMVEKVFYTPHECRMINDTFSHLCMYQITNGKINRLACLIQTSLEHTFSQKMLLSFPAEKNIRQRRAIGGVRGRLRDKQERVTLEDFLLL